MADMSRNGGFTNVQPPMEVDFIFPAAGGGGTAATAVWFNDAHEAALWKKPYAPMLHAGGATTTTTSSHGSSTKMYCEPYGVHGTTQMPTHPSNHLYPNPDGAVTSASAAAAAVAAGSAGGVAVKVEAGTCSQVKWFRNIDPNMDPKRLKRVISNRISAHKSRMKKLQYVTEMEKKVKSLEKEIAELSPQVALHEHHHNLLKMENSFLQQTLSTRTNEKIVMEALIEHSKAEVSRLQQRQLSLQHQGQATPAMTYGWDPAGPKQQLIPNLYTNQYGPDQILDMKPRTG